MPLYNTRPYVRGAIESILKQTYPDFTLLVINDGSTDGSEQEAASFKDSRMILWHQENQGPGDAMNRATQYALDQWIPFLARMDSDDISLPQRLETQILLLEKFPAAAACSANCYYIDNDTEQIIGSSTVSTSPALIHWEIAHGLRGLIQGTCVFRTAALAAVGGYRAQFKRAEE
ncbi:MAG: glycosyltransferase family A protein, partial [Deltaproteobacteria bacterium]|nr:glycosyltransferase family A protein [Deltaproteobacteria bacterium]